MHSLHVNYIGQHCPVFWMSFFLVKQMINGVLFVLKASIFLLPVLIMYIVHVSEIKK